MFRCLKNLILLRKLLSSDTLNIFEAEDIISELEEKIELSLCDPNFPRIEKLTTIEAISYLKDNFEPVEEFNEKAYVYYEVYGRKNKEWHYFDLVLKVNNKKIPKNRATMSFILIEY